MTRQQKIRVSIVTTLVVTLLSFWFIEQSPPSAVGRFLRSQEDILFPFAWLAALFLGRALWLTCPLALFQFPAYSVALDWAWIRRRAVPAIVLLVVLHFAAALFCQSLR